MEMVHGKMGDVRFSRWQEPGNMKDAFLPMKNSGLTFRTVLVTNGTAYSGISKNEDNLARCTQIFR